MRRRTLSSTAVQQQAPPTSREASLVMAPPSDLQRLDERPQQRPNALPFAQQLDQSHHSEQAEEGDGHTGAILATLTARQTE